MVNVRKDPACRAFLGNSSEKRSMGRAISGFWIEIIPVILEFP